MAERMDQSLWAILPTKKTLDAIDCLTEYNTTAGIHERKHFTEVRCARYACIQILTTLGTSRTRV